MIKYALTCAEGHAFESWFASGAAYDSLAEAGRLTCAVCGGGGVRKALMAPRLGAARPGAAPAAEAGPETGAPADGSPADRPAADAPAAGPRAGPPADGAPADGPTAPGPRRRARPGPPSPAALAEFRRRVEAVTEDVGPRFADEARAIHEGRAPERAIRGEADAAEARALADDGVPVLPLPFPPRRKLN
jgi:hypothetical protein